MTHNVLAVLVFYRAAIVSLYCQPVLSILPRRHLCVTYTGSLGMEQDYH